jgi:hypothetical protein
MVARTLPSCVHVACRWLLLGAIRVAMDGVLVLQLRALWRWGRHAECSLLGQPAVFTGHSESSDD